MQSWGAGLGSSPQLWAKWPPISTYGKGVKPAGSFLNTATQDAALCGFLHARNILEPTKDIEKLTKSFVLKRVRWKMVPDIRRLVVKGTMTAVVDHPFLRLSMPGFEIGRLHQF